MILVDAIFFDVDGTLVDARHDIVKAMNYTLRKLSLPEKTAVDIVSYVGTGVMDLVRKSLGSKSARLVDKAIKIFGDYYMEHSADEATLYPHVKETLAYFKDKRKYILTNRYSRFADVTLKKMGIRDYFEDILGGDDENCLKPSACVVDMAFDKFKVDKAKSIIVGDMSIDVMTGKNSGIKTCWVTYGLGVRKDVDPLKPDYVIDDIIELKRIIR